MIGTTSAAILGLVAVQAGTAYELARRMERNHRFIWPRAESKLYEEVKRLHALGLLEAEAGSTGRRPRVVYSITRRGEAALEAWAKTESARPLLEIEALVKLAYADFGTVEDARAQVAAILAHATEMEALGLELGRTYLDEAVELPERAHTNVLVWGFLARHFRAMREWAEWADGVLASWDGTKASRKNTEVTRRAFEDGMAHLTRRARRR